MSVLFRVEATAPKLADPETIAGEWHLKKRCAIPELQLLALAKAHLVLAFGANFDSRGAKNGENTACL